MLLKPVKKGITGIVTLKLLYSEGCHFLALAGIPYKCNQCHTIVGGLSSVCAKIEPANPKIMNIRDKCPAEIYTAFSLHLAY